jgi:hypothetical protein
VSEIDTRVNADRATNGPTSARRDQRQKSLVELGASRLAKFLSVLRIWSAGPSMGLRAIARPRAPRGGICGRAWLRAVCSLGGRVPSACPTGHATAVWCGSLRPSSGNPQCFGLSTHVANVGVAASSPVSCSRIREPLRGVARRGFLVMATAFRWVPQAMPGTGDVPAVQRASRFRAEDPPGDLAPCRSLGGQAVARVGAANQETRRVPVHILPFECTRLAFPAAGVEQESR